MTGYWKVAAAAVFAAALNELALGQATPTYSLEAVEVNSTPIPVAATELKVVPGECLPGRHGLDHRPRGGHSGACLRVEGDRASRTGHRRNRGGVEIVPGQAERGVGIGHGARLRLRVGVASYTTEVRSVPDPAAIAADGIPARDRLGGAVPSPAAAFLLALIALGKGLAEFGARYGWRISPAISDLNSSCSR